MAEAAADDEPPGPRMLIYALAGLAVFLLALIAVVVAARQLRPVIVGPDDSSEKSLAEQIEQLQRTKDADERQAAAEAIVAQGLPAVAEALDAIAAVASPGAVPEMSLPAIRALAETGPQSAAIFGQALDSEKEDVRAAAASVLREMGVNAKGAVAPLAKALGDKSRWVRWAATEALGNIGPDAAAAVEALIPLVTHEDRFTRRRAVAALGAIGPAAKPAVPSLKKAGRRTPTPRSANWRPSRCTRSIWPGMAAAAAAQANQEVREQIARLQSPDESASVAAANALGKMGPRGSDAVPALAMALQSDRKWLRVAAAEALGAMGREAKNVAPALHKAAAEQRPRYPRRRPGSPGTNRGPAPGRLRSTKPTTPGRRSGRLSFTRGAAASNSRVAYPRASGERHGRPQGDDQARQEGPHKPNPQIAADTVTQHGRSLPSGRPPPAAASSS